MTEDQPLSTEARLVMAQGLRDIGLTSPAIEKTLGETSSPIYGGTGHGSGDARQLVVIQKLADRSSNTRQERIQLLDSDMREAMVLAAKRLDAEAQKYSNVGFTWNLDDIVYEHGGVRTLTATLRISRGGA